MEYGLGVYFFAQVILKGFGYRLRGMAHANLNDTMARVLFWALPFMVDGGIFAHLMHMSGMMFFAVVFASFAGAFIASTIPHSEQQADSISAKIGMGVIVTLMFGIMILPEIIYRPVLAEVMALSTVGGIVASVFSYSSWWQGRYPILKIFGIMFCVPWDSSWEEFFIGCFGFGIPIAVLGGILL